MGHAGDIGLDREPVRSQDFRDASAFAHFVPSLFFRASTAASKPSALGLPHKLIPFFRHDSLHVGIVHVLNFEVGVELRPRYDFFDFPLNRLSRLVGFCRLRLRASHRPFERARRTWGSALSLVERGLPLGRLRCPAGPERKCPGGAADLAERHVASLRDPGGC